MSLIYLVSNPKCHLSFSFIYGDFFFCTKVKKIYGAKFIILYFHYFSILYHSYKAFYSTVVKENYSVFACTWLHVCTFRSTWSLSWHTVWDLYLVLSFPTSYLVVLGCILSPCLFTCMQSTSCKMLSWMKHKLESRLPGEISILSDMQMTPPLWQKAKRNWRASRWKWKRRVKKLA